MEAQIEAVDIEAAPEMSNPLSETHDRTNEPSEEPAPAGQPRVAGSAFEYLTLSLFADRTQGVTQLLRSQHSEIQMGFERIRDLLMGGADKSSDIKMVMVSVFAQVHLHLALERGVMGKQMSTDPRGRVMFDQFDLELAPLLSTISELSRSFPNPSAIASDFAGFKAIIERAMRLIDERFRHEERDLYVEFDRMFGA